MRSRSSGLATSARSVNSASSGSPTWATSSDGNSASIAGLGALTTGVPLAVISKMRRAQVRMTEPRPYAEKISRTIANLSQANTEVTHPFMADRPVTSVGVLVVSTDRGLCRGLNTNLFRQLAASQARHNHIGNQQVNGTYVVTSDFESLFSVAGF